ncbi:MAG TPA: DedA family protein [Candidatus Saccharimonadales bacterium]|nr:DedA family protein [Candidatus Saccharimonadales bacterium]
MTVPSEHLPQIIQSAEPLINKYGYFAVAGLITGEDFGLPLPGETTLIAAAILAGIGSLNIVAVAVVAVVAAIVGDSIGYLIGYLAGKPLIEKFGKYIFINKARIDSVERFFSRKGGWVVTFARFIDGLRQLNGIVAGFSSMTWRKFIVFNSIGAVLWVFTWTGIGYYGGSHLQTLLRYQIYLTVAIGLVILALIVRFALKRLKKRTEKA